MRHRRTLYLVLASVCFYAVASANQRPSMFGLCWASLSLLAVARVVCWLSGHGVRLDRPALPQRGRAGEPLPMRLRLSNLGSFAKGNLLITDAVENLTQRTQVERRVLVSWLPGSEALAVEPPQVIASRGRVRLGPVRLKTSDPIGLFEKEQAIEAAPIELLIHPKLLELTGLRGEGSWGGQATLRARASQGMDFRNLRDYQFGDDLRHIDWKATARTGDLHIREYERPVAQDATLVLDLDHRQIWGHGEQGTLEQSVSLTASMAVRLRQLGYTVRLVAEDRYPLNLVVRPGTAAPTGLLDQLAEVAGVGQTDALTLLEREAAKLSEDRLLVLLTADCHPLLADWLIRSRGAGRQKAMVILYDARSFAAAQPAPDTLSRVARRTRLDAPPGPPDCEQFVNLLRGTAIDLVRLRADEDPAAMLRAALGGRL